MFGPFTPTLLALLTRRPSLLKLPTLRILGDAAKEHARRELCHDRIAVVTGAASGIGAALARALARNGCTRLVLADLFWHAPDTDLSDTDSPQQHALVQELEREHSAQVLALTVDVGSLEQIKQMRDATLDRFGAPHMLFNNAGVGMPGVLSATDEALRKAIDINLFSVLDGARAFAPVMEAAHGGGETAGDGRTECHIVNTASLAGISEACGLYGLTKHAVVAATEAMASELAWRRSNVRVSVVCPSYVASNVVATTARAQAQQNLTSEGVPPTMDEATAAEVADELQGLGRLVADGMQPDCVADLVLSGMVEGRRYIYTDLEHTVAALADRVEQLEAGGLPEGFQRRMERVVQEGLHGKTE